MNFIKIYNKKFSEINKYKKKIFLYITVNILEKINNSLTKHK
jgi:hypothetical protein